MLRLNVPSSAYATQEVSLGGSTYTIVYSFNERDSAWRLDIYLAGDLVIGGVKVMPDASLIGRRHSLENFDHGDLQCVQFSQDDNLLGRDNFGIDKSFELVYFSYEELGL